MKWNLTISIKNEKGNTYKVDHETVLFYEKGNRSNAVRELLHRLETMAKDAVSGYFSMEDGNHIRETKQQGES